MELVSNRHLSSISCKKCRYVGGKYNHFMTANNHIDYILDDLVTIACIHGSPLNSCSFEAYVKFSLLLPSKYFMLLWLIK
jgi:hypothetical protein